jgi:hypothetical protein
MNRSEKPDRKIAAVEDAADVQSLRKFLEHEQELDDESTRASFGAQFGPYISRLPRNADRELWDALVSGDSQREIAQERGGRRQSTISIARRRLLERLEFILRYPSLQLKYSDKIDIMEALLARAFSKAEALYLWELYWTSSKKCAEDVSGVTKNLNFTKKFIKMSFGDSSLETLRRGLEILDKKVRWGFLWGREKRRSRT